MAVAIQMPIPATPMLNIEDLLRRCCWQAQYGIPLTRVTTHAAVDRSRSRYDPRSFRWDRFDPHYQGSARLCGFERFDNGQAGL